MVQLKVYDGSDQYFLDLLSTDPIKLTLSIEDITNADARSTFSRTFRVPSTKNNNQFFKNAFLVDGIDYDVTVKKKAEILYNGAEYKVGHIRLQKIYHNKMERNTEYEIVFLGETRDFASALGEKTLSQLDLSEYNHTLNYANVTASWQAYPEGTTNAGLFNGDILYPLVSFGTANGEPLIAYSPNQGSNTFDKSQNAIDFKRLKPMIRAKALWDKIFAEAGFTYESQIADADDFRQLYVSAWGNDPGVYEELGSSNYLDLGLSSTQPFSGYSLVEWDVVNLDPSNNYNTSTYQYQVPVTGAYEIQVRVDISTRGEVRGGAIDIELWEGANPLDSDSITVPSGTPVNTAVNLTYSGQLNQNNYVRVEVSESGDVGNSSVGTSSYWKITNAPGEVGIASQLDSDYKQIDFIKDMITKFRLVMAPDKTDPKKFIVEPWADYIATGDVLDWSSKLDESKDLQLEPLFFTQSSFIEFSDKEDKDWLNELNIKKFKETFGTLRVESTNELLKGKREIKTNFAPTPITQIEGATNSNFIIPRIYAISTEEANQGDTVLERTPIKPVTRLLFYNGLFTQTGFINNNDGTPGDSTSIGDWHMLDDTASPANQSHFPMVSYWQDFDAVTGPGNDTVNLNWQIEPGYAAPYASFNYTNGVSMYQRFWSTYINSLYSKFARRLTAYFALSVEDLFNFSFDDVIFVNGTYYRPEKLTDVIVGQKSLVKVDLIKLLDYGLANPGAGVGGDAGGDTGDNPGDGSGTGGQITYTDSNGHVYTTTSTVWEMTPCNDPNATPIIVGPANMQVQSGQSSVVGSQCYEFVQPVFWQESYGTPIEVVGTQSWATCADCQCETAPTLTSTAYPSAASSSQACDGDIVVQIQGGTAPYSTVLTDSSNTVIATLTGSNPIFTGLCCDDYTATTTDACGNTTTDTVRVLCGPDGPSGPSN